MLHYFLPTLLYCLIACILQQVEATERRQFGLSRKHSVKAKERLCSQARPRKTAVFQERPWQNAGSPVPCLEERAFSRGGLCL